MNRNGFNILLDTAGLNRKSFSPILGTTCNTINAWDSNNCEIYYLIKPWLAIYSENKKCNELKKLFKNSKACKE